MTKSVSVLVAVYNAAPYLKQCLDSLLSQTLKDIQILCMDDCSTDDSWEILQDFARRDTRVEIFQMPENSGQAKARNALIPHLRGKYVTFLDSDDWLSCDALENCVKVFDEHDDADCVLLRLLQVDEKGGEVEYDRPIPPSLTGFEAFKLSLNWGIHGCYVARCEFFEKWPYDDTCRSYSDDNSTRLHYYHSRRIYYAPDARYFYRKNAQSTTQRISVSRYDYLRANTSMKRQLLELQVSDEILNLYENHRWVNCVGLYMFYYQNRRSMTAEENRYGLQEIKSVWKSIEVKRLRPSNRYKLGYIPLQGSWTLFRIEEEIYFFLRNIKNRWKNIAQS